MRAGMRRLRVRPVFVVVLALAIAGLVAVQVWGFGDGGIRGRTEQGESMKLVLDDHGQVIGLTTHIVGRCPRGQHRTLGWDPQEGAPVHFVQHRNLVSTREVGRSQVGGEILTFTVTMNGQLRGDHASGTVRAIMRWYDQRGVEVGACDSGDVRWAVGRDVDTQIAEFPIPRHTDGYEYPLVPSLAVSQSPAQRAFARRVDQKCKATARRGWLREEAAWQRRRGRRDGYLRVWAAYVAAHAARVRAIDRLGPPPADRADYDRWRDTLVLQLARVRRVFVYLKQGRLRLAHRIYDRLDSLRTRSNEAGMKFGLTLCTSGGPDRTPAVR
jgi:hypothetical protein